MNSKQCPRCKQTNVGGNYHYIVNMKLVSAKTNLRLIRTGTYDGYARHDVKWVCQNRKCGFSFVETKVGKELFLDYCDIPECTDIEVVKQ